MQELHGPCRAVHVRAVLSAMSFDERDRVLRDGATAAGPTVGAPTAEVRLVSTTDRAELELRFPELRYPLSSAEPHELVACLAQHAADLGAALEHCEHVEPLAGAALCDHVAELRRHLHALARSLDPPHDDGIRGRR